MASPSGPRRLPCSHKSVARCMVGTPGCCACSDNRPHAHDYYVYVDGAGSVPQGTRWSFYCDHCKAFWESHIRRAGISASQSRVPEFPRQNTTDAPPRSPRSPTGPRRTFASTFSQMEQYLTNNSIPHRTSLSRPLFSMSRASRASREREREREREQEQGREREREQEREREREIDSPSAGGDTDSTGPIITRRRVQRFHNLRSSSQMSSSGSEGSMDAHATSTTAADDPEIPVQPRNQQSFAESRAQITDLENQLDRLHARMLVGRSAHAAREERRESDRRLQLFLPQRHFQPRSRPEFPAAEDRSWASNTTDGSNSIASLDGINSNASLEVQVSTPERPPRTDPSEDNTLTSNLAAERPLPRIWSLANSVHDIETELAHLTEGAAQRAAELASLSQQLEQQTRQHPAHRYHVDEAGMPGNARNHSDILGRASEGLRQLRELHERREQHERAEHIQQVWGNVDDDDYTSPVSALFQRSWQAYTHRQQLEREGLRATPQPVWFPDGGGDPDPASIRTPFDLTSAADDASSLLQSFRENLDDDGITPEQQDLIDRAVEGILRMRREVRARSREGTRRSRRSRGPGPGVRNWEPKGFDDAERPPPLDPELLVLDCECKVCFGQVADTVLLPCSHLVLCGWCADTMGIRRAPEFARPVQCPVCRADVVDRIKVFRG